VLLAKVLAKATLRMHTSLPATQMLSEDIFKVGGGRQARSPVEPRAPLAVLAPLVEAWAAVGWRGRGGIWAGRVWNICKPARSES